MKEIDIYELIELMGINQAPLEIKYKNETYYYVNNKYVNLNDKKLKELQISNNNLKESVEIIRDSGKIKFNFQYPHLEHVSINNESKKQCIYGLNENVKNLYHSLMTTIEKQNEIIRRLNGGNNE